MDRQKTTKETVLSLLWSKEDTQKKKSPLDLKEIINAGNIKDATELSFKNLESISVKRARNLDFRILCIISIAISIIAINLIGLNFTVLAPLFTLTFFSFFLSKSQKKSVKIATEYKAQENILLKLYEIEIINSISKENSLL